MKSNAAHDARRPPVIVLCMTGTGMAAVRTLAECGIEVHAFLFRPDEPIHYSRYAKKVRCYELENDHERLVHFLSAYARKLDRKPIVMPTSDAHALMLAQHSAALSRDCQLWTTSYEDLARIINKDGLYQMAAKAGVPTIPCIASPSLAQLSEWARCNAGPYLLKPAYEGARICQLREKNLLLKDSEALLKYAELHGTEALVVQRMLCGGDGYIFDCYGLCDRDGSVLTTVTHRRLRQHLPDFGASCFGEIPAGLPQEAETLLMENSRRLLRAVRYHGIFGIEWLYERASGNFYIIDFNARLFSTIGHLSDCGLNLPHLAYQELTGGNLHDLESRPRVKHKYWIDLARDIDTFKCKQASGEISSLEWMRSVLLCRSFAYASVRDPGPGLYAILQIVRRLWRFLFHTRRVTRGDDENPPARSTPAKARSST